MSNRLLTIQEVSKNLVKGFTKIFDEEGIPEKDRAKLTIAALSPLMCSPSPRQKPKGK